VLSTDGSIICAIFIVSFYASSVSFRFFFYGSAARRDLHSFPTRRSSDLALSSTRDRGRPQRPPRSAIGLARRHATSVARDPRDADRKSTRLNSSHVKISYAVFCLKKKKKTNT